MELLYVLVTRGMTQDSGAGLVQLERGALTAAPGLMSGASHGAAKLPRRPQNVGVYWAEK